MNQPWFQRGFRRAVACGAVIAVGGALAMAQAAQTGGQSADGQVEMDVVHALDAQQTLANDLITAATVNGTVTLTGTVSSQASKDLAERVVRGVAGVSAVQDNLQVGNPENDPNAQAGQNVDEGAASEDNGPPSGAGTPGNPPQWSQQPNEAPNQAQNQAQDEGANSNDANQPPVNSPNAGQRPEYGQAPQAGNGPGNGLSAPDWGPAGPPPGYGQNQGQNQGQAPPQAGNGPGNGQNAPDWGPAGPPPGYGQSQGQQQGQAPPPGYGQAPPPPGYGQGPNAQGPYAQGPYGRQYGGEPGPEPGRPNYQYAQGPLTVPMGTLIQVRTNEPVASKRATAGTPVEFTVIQDVTLGGVLAIPRGATVHGVVEEAKQSHSGQLGGSSELALRLTSLDLGGQSYPLASDLFKVRGPSKAGRTVGSAIGGALIGAIIGGAAGGGGGAAIGAAAGGTLGTAASAAAPGPGVWIPAEALVSFHLARAVTVAPVGQQEADRLAQGLYQGGPRLYQRRRYGYYGGPYGPPGYGYPGPYPYYGPVYYRPYYFSGGFYYWR